MQVRIYQPAKTAMQSGRAKTHAWILEYELATARRPEPLMGWTSSGDTLNQVKLTFDSAEEAIAYATRKGWAYEVITHNDRIVRPKNYADNFRTDRPRVGRF
ncbi:ETC complex I subunit [Nitrospirillum viridazoti]|uniref:Oxidoreductase n=1 Tax=Nitrospirillum viridazoti CBAmc TaxID=1441467 RepID=A0A248JWV7_9PROT|nr:ETC complex I subunit [Nitrospirillum amazonense]ASG23020.1 oxidoreductase [Nitrospirillum amazonense CBAmc]TWB38739.1 ETC complex I subunit-like protein [Nitrospirillum amazonense]